MKKRALCLPVAAVVIAVCCGARVKSLAPFGTPMFAALCGELFLGFTAPVYLLSTYLLSFELWRLYAACGAAAVMTVGGLLGAKFARFRAKWVKTLFCLAAIAAECGLQLLFAPVADAAITFAVSALFLYFARYAAKCTADLFAHRPGAAESSSVFAVLVAAGLCFGRARAFGLELGLAPVMLLLLLLATSGKNALTAGGAAVALGFGLQAGLQYMGALVLLALTLGLFGALPRAVYSLAGITVFAAAAVLFGGDPIDVGYGCAFLAAGALPFIAVPPRAIRGMRAYFDFDGSARLAVRHYINRTKADAGARMLAVASVFDETARLMNELAPPPADCAAIGAGLRSQVCSHCAHADRCDHAAADAAFTALAECASGGKAILSDLPEFFTRDCKMTMDVISAASVVTDNARATARERESEQKAKLIVAERLRAVKDVLEELGNAQARPVGFDGAAEERIQVELNDLGVECAQAFVSGDGVTAIVRTACADGKAIRSAVSACLNRNCELVGLEKTQAAGWSVATLKKRPLYEAAYARAGLGKNGVTGDSYTFERIGDRFLAALLDGMGSGEAAEKSSDAAVELIECFYRAGFDSQSVLTGVNRFLKLPASENYSAADIAVCDLDSGRADIIKLGSPPCYIKTADTVLRISGSSLPIGVLDEMRPYTVSKNLYPGQMLIMVTDGVNDCFGGDELPEFINGLSPFNPEAAANAIVSRALELSGSVPRDDMTAVALRLFDAPKSDVKGVKIRYK